MTEADLEQKILDSLSSISGTENFAGLWGKDKTEEANDDLIVRVVVNPLSFVDDRIKKTTVELALAVRKECDIEGDIFSSASNELLEIVNEWKNNYKKSVQDLSVSTFVPCPQIIIGTDGKLEINSSSIDNLNTSADFDASSNASFLKCSFDLYGIQPEEDDDDEEND